VALDELGERAAVARRAAATSAASSWRPGAVI
jgi:hypothetical protein